MIIIGLDPGFGGIKVAAIENGTLRTAHVPAAVGVGSTDLGFLSIGSLGRRRRTQQPDVVTLNGVTYLVGHNVHLYARPVERTDFLHLTGGPELRAALYAALARGLPPGQSTVYLMLGLPVQIMADRSQTQATLRTIRGWLVGDHHFTVNNVAYTVQVLAVKAMAQPAGTFFAWGMDDTGRWTRTRRDLTVPVAICDIGFNTLDLFAVEGGTVIAQYTAGDTLGMRRAVDLLIDDVRRRYGVRLTRHQADALLRERHPRLHTADGEVALDDLVQQALDVTAGYVVSFLERHWETGRQFERLFFTGGGALALKEVLLRHYPHGVLLPDPVMANAIGLARYGMRIFRKERGEQVPSPRRHVLSG